MIKRLIILLLLTATAFATVTDTTTKYQYFSPNGSNTTFTFTMPCNSSDDIKVEKILTSTGVPETLVEDTDYTIAATSSDYLNGGVVTISPALAGTYDLTITRNIVLTQELDSGAVTHITTEDAFDRSTRQIQDNRNKINLKTIRIPDSDPTTAYAELANYVERAGYWLGFDSSTGAPFAGTPAATGITVSSFMATVNDDASAALAMATLNGIPVFNVKNPVYGATGNGSTDDTTAIQLAFTAGDGNRVHFPQGTYMISSTILFDDIIITGDNATIKLVDGSDDQMFAVDGDFTRIIIDGLTFDGNGDNQTVRKILVDCAEYDGTEYTIQNCTFKNGRTDAGVGKYLSRISNANITKVRILNNLYLDSEDYTGIYISNQDGSVIKDILISENKTQDVTGHLTIIKNTGDATFPYKRVRIIGNDCDTFEDDDGIPIEAWNVEQLSIIGNTIKDCHSGMTIANCDNVIVTGNSIDGADGDATTSRGIELHATASTGVYGHYTVTGNTITNSTMGITLKANDITGGSCLINSNIMDEISFIGIYVLEGTYDVVIDDNQILGGLTAASGSGIYFRGNASADSGNATISNNKIHFKTSGIPIGISVRWIENVVVSDNNIYIDSDATSGAAYNSISINDVTNLRVIDNTLISEVAGSLQGIAVNSNADAINLYIDRNHVQGYFLGIDTTNAKGESANVNVTNNTVIDCTTTVTTNVGHFRNKILSYENSAVFYENEIVYY